MSGVLWGLGQQQGPDPGQRFQQAYDAGIQRQDQQALRGFQIEDRQVQQQQRQAEQQQQLTARQREELRLGARIVREINPTDDAGWQRARAVAQQAGIDVSQVPPTFDPAYRDQLLAAGRALEPQQATEEYTLGRGDIRFRGSTEIARGGRPPDQIIPVTQGGGTYRQRADWPEPPTSQQPSAEAPAFNAPPQSEADLRAAAQAALDRGVAPAVVQQRLDQLLQQMRGGAAPGPQTFP